MRLNVFLIMSEKPSPDQPELDYDQRTELVEQAWAEMISDRVRDPETRAQAETELRQVRSESAESRVDSVTGLANHRGFTERLQMVYEYVLRHRHEGTSLHVDVIDVKDLAGWNLSPDQSTGDRVLHTLADVLRTVSQRGTDYPARVGGDEFAVIRENGSPNDIFVERLRGELDKPERYIDGKKIEIYVGGADWEGHGTAEDVYKAAQGRMSMTRG